MKYYIQILNCDGKWINYALRHDYKSAAAVAKMLEKTHNFEEYQTRIRS